MRKTAFFGGFKKFFKKFNVPNKIIRYWTKETLENDPGAECDYGYITQIIKLKDGVICGIQAFDDRYPGNKYPMIEYYNLNDIDIVYCEGDAEDQ